MYLKLKCENLSTLYIRLERIQLAEEDGAELEISPRKKYLTGEM